MLIALLAAAAAATAAPGSETIVVTGVPLSQLKSEAERCVKGGCTLRQDTVASVRYAEGLFRVGRYVDSRKQLERTIARNRANAKSDPAAMSALYEATATVARHDGEQLVVANATYARARLLRDTAGAESPQRMLADLDILDVEAPRREQIQTDTKYRLLAKRALELNEPRVAAQALLHHAAFAQSRGRKAQAGELLQKVISGEVPASPTYRLVARSMAARYARGVGDTRPADALVADYLSQPQAIPVLLWAPAVNQPTSNVFKDPLAGESEGKANASAEYFYIRWVDIGFTIRADGSVADVDVLRGNRGEAWAAPLTRAIAARRYMPLKADSPFSYRVERWTLTADYDIPKGSVIHRRVRNPHFEQLDVTGEPPRTAEVRPPRGPSPAE